MAEQGAQIDIIIVRVDNIIHVCEIKFYHAEFITNQKNAANWRNKLAQFAALDRNKKKTLFFTLITSLGVFDNMYAKELVTKCHLSGRSRHGSLIHLLHLINYFLFSPASL